MFTYESTQFDIEGFILVCDTCCSLLLNYGIAIGDISVSDHWCPMDVSSDITTEARAWYVWLMLKLKSL